MGEGGETMKKNLKRWAICAKGTTAVEYSLLIAGITLAILLTTFTFGSEIANFFDTFFDEWQNR